MDSSHSTDPPIRILVIGDSGAGKTRMMFRFTDDAFAPNGPITVGVDFRVREVTLDGDQRRVEIWDTAGQERFRAIVESFYRRGDAIALVFDVSNRASFDHIPSWFESVQRRGHGADSTPIVLIGNKADLGGVVSTEEGIQMAERYGVEFFHTSALNGKNIEEAFTSLAMRVIQKMTPQAHKVPVGGLNLAGENPGEDQGENKLCC